MKDQAISRYMIRFPICGSPSMSLENAANILRQNRIRHLPIMSAQEDLIGIVSERDLKAAQCLEQAPMLTLGDIMKKDVYMVTKDVYLSEVALQMAEGKLGSVVIVDTHGKPIGVFTTTDALYLLADELEEKTLEDYLTDHRDIATFDEERLI